MHTSDFVLGGAELYRRREYMTMRAILAVLLVLPTIFVAVAALLAVLPTTSKSTSESHVTADAVDYRGDDYIGGGELGLVWQHGDEQSVVEAHSASEAPAFTTIATDVDVMSRHLATGTTSTDRHNVAVWAHKDIYDPLLYSYNNHTFTAQRNTGSGSDQVGQWRHIRGATKPGGLETIIVGVSKDEKWVRGMLLQEASAGGATQWYQIKPATLGTGVLATLGTNQFAAVDVQYESNSEDALLVWST